MKKHIIYFLPIALFIAAALSRLLIPTNIDASKEKTQTFIIDERLIEKAILNAVSEYIAPEEVHVTINKTGDINLKIRTKKENIPKKTAAIALLPEEITAEAKINLGFIKDSGKLECTLISASVNEIPIPVQKIPKEVETKISDYLNEKLKERKTEISEINFTDGKIELKVA